ncbi:MAG: hypothetical protein E5Y73_01930 [Mesorhizobium sp.]|uniref:hypothetical protein n=1 Tax=Mesorhizobium sp. TaxID=1871066 RepID=UPI00120D652C|nr:hypothetical protein [Mesorhizobium sp.]TIL96291.1 MAG: hypothetical protein E5Y73_01930 [Mesorhizobium sp.]
MIDDRPTPNAAIAGDPLSSRAGNPRVRMAALLHAPPQKRDQHLPRKQADKALRSPEGRSKANVSL